MAKKICDAYMTYTCSCAFIENNLVDKKVSQKFKELKDAIVEQAKDYDTFAGKSKTMDGSVAFVMKTDTIKAPKKEKNKKTIEKKKGALAWLKDLFGID